MSSGPNTPTSSSKRSSAGTSTSSSPHQNSYRISKFLQFLSFDLVLGDVDDDAMNLDAKPFAERGQIAGRRPRGFVLGPRGELELEQPLDVVFDPFLHVLF